MELKRHGRYDYSPITERQAYDWPEGKRLAFYIGLNIEHFSFGEGLGHTPTNPGVQPDVGEAGITECLRISKYAENNGIKVIPHSWHNGLMVVASAHFASSLLNPQFVEMCMVQGPLQWDILKEYPIKSGSISLDV